MGLSPKVGMADLKKRVDKGPVVGRRYMHMSAYGKIERSNAEYHRSRNPFVAEEEQPAQPAKKTTNKKKEVRTRGRKKKVIAPSSSTPVVNSGNEDTTEFGKVSRYVEAAEQAGKRDMEDKGKNKVASPKRKKRADSFLNAHPLDQAERNIAKMGNKKGEDDNEDEAPAHRRETHGHLAAEMEEVKQAEAASLACQPVTKVDDTVWPPYGTDEFPPTEPTYCLGLARLPAEIADDFKAELAKDLQKFYQRLQFSSEPVQEFGQELEDVGVEFISKDVAVAKQVKDAINGVEVLGKKVQVTFANNW